MVTFSGTGNTLFLPATTSLGIGTSSPAYPLDVAGDARIQHNLIVGGGIIITDAIRADTVYMAAGSVIEGNATVNGNVTVSPNRTLTAGATNINGQLRVDTAYAAQTGSIDVRGDIRTNSKLTVSGNATFNGVINANQGLNFSGSNSFRYSNANQTEMFTLGKTVSGGFVLPPRITSNPGTSIGGVLLDVVGAIIARDASNLYPTIMGFDGANHILEAGSTGATTSPGVFLINYYCGKPTLINTGNNGGDVHAGGIGKVYLSKTIIGVQTQTTGPHTDAMLTVNGKIVSKSCYIRIADWADYVFAKDYKMPNLYDVEKILFS